MGLRLYDIDSANLLLERNYPQTFFSIDGGIQECVTHLGASFGEGYYKEIFFDGIHIGYGHANLYERVLFRFESDFETVEMHFALKGKSQATGGTLSKTINFETYQHNILYGNSICGQIQWEGNEIQLCEINLSPVFFKKFIPDNSILFNDFRNIIDKGKSGLLKDGNRRITHEMYAIIDSIVTCERKGIFKKIYLESKIMELLLLQLEQLSDTTILNTTLKKTDVDKIYAVREFLLENIDSNNTLVNLAHLVGTNEFTLKKGFKELFGTTVFGFWNDAKMEHAKKLILDKNMTIGEVSDAVGYKNQRHFSDAFRRKFGFPPSKLKK
ncbi:AraC family transcriptional regulator [Sphingobacterium puteale]|uniref:AraC family transcriptional regulator n=1 Tax=Sphingobacterium puteale TaxID=2420510 RepID=A0A420VU84_9SPHI|nr:AraC family transcriptional regulator [Sphingobacterium puteale]RKO69835.1 AraC family transcriptional regulator [Sphingobacterium puteale]